MITIIVAEQFSRYPAGRFTKDGPFSGESFRTKHLVPALRGIENIVIELDGVRGYGSSFLEEAFGGLVRLGFLKNDLKTKIALHAKNKSLTTEILEYIEKAVPTSA